MRPFFSYSTWIWIITGLASAVVQAREVDTEKAKGSEPEAIRSAVVPDASKATDVMEEAKAAAAPVPVPPLSHYAALWQRSMFTTLDLPAPEVPQGPGFADQMVLAGTYEVDGAVVAVILDKMTAQVSEARIGSDNEMGVRIKSVEPGTEGSVRRVQLQKGMQSGWIQVAEVASGGPPPTSTEANPTGIGAPAQPLMPKDGSMDAGVRGPVMPSANVPTNMNPPSVVQPLPASRPAQPGGAATPNPSLDDIPLPPD
jgi:hypothetical protein